MGVPPWLWNPHETGQEKLAAHVTAANVNAILYLAGTGAQKAASALVGGADGIWAMRLLRLAVLLHLVSQIHRQTRFLVFNPQKGRYSYLAQLINVYIYISQCYTVCILYRLSH